MSVLRYPEEDETYRKGSDELRILQEKLEDIDSKYHAYEFLLKDIESRPVKLNGLPEHLKSLMDSLVIEYTNAYNAVMDFQKTHQYLDKGLGRYIFFKKRLPTKSESTSYVAFKME